MKRILAGLLGVAVVAGSSAALAQPYVYYPGYAYDRYDDGWRHDNGRHRGWYKHHRRHYGYRRGYAYRYNYNYAPVRVCAWRYGERVCWWTR